MRIGVMTFWWSEDNYGQLLQCYALQKYLRDLGHDAFLIRYRMKEAVPFGLKGKLIKYGLHPWRIFDGFRRIASRRRGRADLVTHDRKFDEFRKTNLKVSDHVYYSIEELRANPPSADMYIVGSDQVWRFDELFTVDDIHAMMLDFGPEVVNRISYAASFGRTCLMANVLPDLPSLFKRLKAVSVREATGVEICVKYGRKDAVQVCDPTLLLTVDAYEGIAERPALGRPYVFCYMLTNTCGFNYKALEHWADAQGLGIVYVTGNSVGVSKYEDESAAKSYLTIQQWLGFLSKAEYVVTNSFHCCVFATHFNRRLGVILLGGDVANMNTRIRSLNDFVENSIVCLDGCDYGPLESSAPMAFRRDANLSGRAFLKAALMQGDGV